ncbi:MAG: selenide, water dikinase SelD, partial [Actinobacteria bacterium]|nr:selenide, water dikinase SelD [Actinomycetota bacterium]
MTLDVTRLSLRDLTSCGGCAAKADASLLRLLRGAAYDQQGSDTLVGLAEPDDAAVTAINETTSLITTIDFFPPVVSDPFDYGYVSALNSLSDIYAMGGLAKTALLVCGFPKEIDDSEIAECVSGAALACKEAGVEILGGHTVRITEPIFGLAATGYVHPNEIWRKTGINDGDLLMLSKPLGVGVLLSTREPSDEKVALEQMKISNLSARNSLVALGPAVHAVTDVTGFGLVGHLSEMLGNSALDAKVRLPSQAVLPQAQMLFESGKRTSADTRNRGALDREVLGLTESHYQA